MDFSLSDEQRMLDETVTRLVADRCTPEQRRRLIQERGTAPSALWNTFAELGLLAMPFGEDAGGLGGDGIDLMLIMQALGRGLVPEAYLDGLVIPGTLLARLADDTLRDRWLTSLLEGEHQLALAWHEAASRYDIDTPATRAERSDDGWRLQGRKQVVLNAPGAAALLVTAGLADDSLGLFIVPADAEGLQRRDYTTLDDQRASDIDIDVTLPAPALLASGEALLAALGEALALGRAALCAEAVGAMEVACEQTLEYLKERQQFGAPLSRQQVLQHRMVDMRLHLEQARSMAILAAASLTLPEEQRDYRVAAAKAYVGEAAQFVAEQAIQLHGGMGMTEECYVAHYAKRLIMLDHALGDRDYHLETVMARLDSAA
ncbi:Acyl-CoA dehydrogenase [Modicisalibacter ilicicola DSM 19980]|uniref:Acyl-CoA dehydrogenase n=1 Tax=Modicisalibacter ilicicola DSM 19980 TaxID=1121942 RepID=A0A1M5EID6_9GAMM|nr:acyl-CoA dehydrogenase [Halomonas ilicicola]SHF79005.1 Acyl-CoA dehydrogenase [Halomonas ilicicola DSM 19980]